MWNTVALRKPDAQGWRTCALPNVIRNGDCCGQNSEGVCGLATLTQGCPAPNQMFGGQCCVKPEQAGIAPTDCAKDRPYWSCTPPNTSVNGACCNASAPNASALCGTWQAVPQLDAGWLAFTSYLLPNDARFIRSGSRIMRRKCARCTCKRLKCSMVGLVDAG